MSQPNPQPSEDEGELAAIRRELREFVSERQWDTFHDSKNLAMLLASEAGELLALLRWVRSEAADAEAAGRLRDDVAQELGDVGIAWLLLCDRTGIDPVECVRDKLARNRANYPVASSRGHAGRPDE